jgi:magnesium transporter
VSDSASLPEPPLTLGPKRGASVSSSSVGPKRGRPLSPTEVRHTAPGASPGTLLIQGEARPRIFAIDYWSEGYVERELGSLEEVIPFLEDDQPSITWVDIRGISHRPTFERLGEIFGIHPLALEDVVNTPQRPHTDAYPEQQLVIARMVSPGESEGPTLHTEQLGMIFGKGFLLTVQEDAERDCLESVRQRIRNGRGAIRKSGSDYLAYALLDAVVDGFYPVLEALGEHLEELELEAPLAPADMPGRIYRVKRDLLSVRRAIWPQRDVINALLRDGSPHMDDSTRVFVRDTYDHAVQVMDSVETFREIASGLMDLYLSGVSNRMNEVMKVLTILSTIFLPVTFIAGVYGMNFDPESSALNMPELRWTWGYPMALGLMVLSVVILLRFYRRKGWLGTDPAIAASRQARAERSQRAP